MNQDHVEYRRGWLWRSRWAAIGAAVAVTLGGGGVFLAHADDPIETQPTFDEFVELRRNSPTASGVASKLPTRAGTVPFDAQAVTTDAGVPGAALVPISPYRVYDSRVFTDGLLLAGWSETLDMTTDQQGRQKIPANAVAVTYNLTVTGTYGVGGYVALFPAAVNWPGNSSINWFDWGLDLSNGGVVSLSSGDVRVLCGDVFETATDYIIDVTGYYIR